MSIQRFLMLAEEGGLLDAATAEKLRVKIQSLDRSVSLEELTDWLVRRGLLTAFQADKLVQATRESESSELDLVSDSSDSQDSTFALGPTPPEQPTKSLELLEEGEGERYTLLEATQDAFTSLPPVTDVVLPPLAHDVSHPMSLEGLDVGSEMPTGDFSAGGWRQIVRLFQPRRLRRGQRWDSSLMLAGGGALLALLILSVFLYSVLAVGSGDEIFQAAEDDYIDQKYTQAIQKFERFVSRHPKHGKASLARVRIGLARMRTDVKAEDWPSALKTGAGELERIRSEASFDMARSELAVILPDVFEGFVSRARVEEETDRKEQLLDQADEVRTMINNPDFLPASLRGQVQARIDRIQDEALQLRREIARRRDIVKSIEEIQQAVANADSTAAYRIRDGLFERHPGADKDAELTAAVSEIARVERQNVAVVDAPIEAVHQPREAPEWRVIPLVTYRTGTAPDLTNRVFAVNTRGAVYGIDGGTGRVLWRRWIGFQSQWQPVSSSDDSAADFLIVDQRFGDLLCLDAPSGELKWRVAVGRPAGPPVVIGDHLLQAAADNTLFFINIVNGTAERRVQFPQKLCAPPAVDLSSGKIFQPASHSTLYVLDAQTLTCIDSLYTGHLEGMVTSAPVVTPELILLLENRGTDASLLHVLVRKKRADEAELAVAGEPIRLQGIVTDAPRTMGRIVVVTTDRGAVYVMETAANNLTEPIRIFAQIHPRTDRSASHFAQLDQSRIFVAGWGLSEFEIQAARGTLGRRWAIQVDDSHFLPPALYGNTLLSARWSSLTQDVIVEAARLPTSGEHGPEMIWETRIAAQPAAPPGVMPDRSVSMIARNGAIWRIHRENVGNPVVESTLSDMPSVGQLLTTVRGEQVYTSSEHRPQWMFAENPSASPRPVILQDANRHQLDVAPVLFAKGMLLCTRAAPVFYVEPSTGRLLCPPVPWPVGISADARWRAPAVADAEFAVLANSHGYVQRLEVSPDDSQLIVTRTHDLKLRIRGNPALLGNSIYVITRGSDRDSLLVLSADSLLPVNNFELAQRAVEPMYVVGQRLIVQTEAEMLALEDGKLSWRIPLEYGLLAGSPTETEDGWWCAARDGHLFRIDPATGHGRPTTAERQAIDVGQPLGVSATLWGKMILAAGHDSTLILVPVTPGGDTP